jgi:hypothetical protein
MRKKRYFLNGKRASKGEFAVGCFLELNNIEYTKEKTFPDLLSENGNPLRFDFYIPEKNLLIEFQGQHHFKPVNKYAKAKRVHETTKMRDEIKRAYCLNNNIALLEINIKDINKVDEILTKYAL